MEGLLEVDHRQIPSPHRHITATGKQPNQKMEQKSQEVRNKEENRDSRRRGSPTLAAAQSPSTGARWRGRPAAPPSRLNESSLHGGGRSRLRRTASLTSSDAIHDIQFGCEVHSYLTPRVKSGPGPRWPGPRDSRELGAMAVVGDGSLLAVYVNVCMALKQLARERGFFGWLLIGKYLELDVDKKKRIKLNSDPSLTSSTLSMALPSSPYPPKTLVLPQYPLNDPPA
ncbi:unnamed protein product [Arctogadus glacialis]